MATMDQLAPTPEEVDTKIVSTLLTYGLSSYQWGKALALTTAPAMDTPLKWIEDKVVETTTLGLKKVSLTPEEVVSKLDGKASEINAHYELDSKFATVKTTAAKQILKLKGEDGMTADLAEEIELQQLIADAREVAWERVSGLQTSASDRVDTLIQDAESYVERVLPDREETATPPLAADEDATKVARVRNLSSTVSRRFKKKAMAKLEGVTLQLRETGANNPIVHLDLVRYSELLDLAAVRERAAARCTVAADTLKGTETYAVVKGYVVKATDKTAALSEDIKSNVQVRVLTPAKGFYAVAAAEFIKRKESANDLYALGSESITSRKAFAVKYLESVKQALGAQWNDKLYAPTMQFLEACEAEFAPLRTAYNEGVENPKNTTEDGKPLTIDAGLAAFVAALRMKLEEEWELRVVPTLEKLKGFNKKEVDFVDLDNNAEAAEADFVDAQSS